jgi:hypothetical protein
VAAASHVGCGLWLKQLRGLVASEDTARISALDVSLDMRRVACV